MELLNEKYKNNKVDGMNYFYECAMEAILTYFNPYITTQYDFWKMPTNKEEFVNLLYNRCNDAKVKNEECKAKGMTGLILNDEYVEEMLITTVFIDKKLSWEDIQHTLSHKKLPDSITKNDFPFDEIKEEMFKQGYVVPKQQEKENVM